MNISKKKNQIRLGFVAIVVFMSCNVLIIGISAFINQPEGAGENGIGSYYTDSKTAPWIYKPPLILNKKYMLHEKWGGWWADVELSPGFDGKGNPGKNNPGDEDDYLSWAAVASNMLEWTGWGFVGGMEKGGADNFFKYYQDHFNDYSTRIDYGLAWWFDGVMNKASKVKEDVNHEGFWKKINPYRYITLFYESNQPEYALSNIRDSFEQECAVSLVIHGNDKNYGGITTFLTCWGFNYNPYLDPIKDKKDYYKGIWITDCHDDSNTINPENKLQYYKVEYDNDDGYWYVLDYHCNGPTYKGYTLNKWRILAIYSLKKIPNQIIGNGPSTDSCRPEAKISIKHNHDSFYWFDASHSKNWEHCRWDFNGDGIWDTDWRTHPSIWHVFKNQWPLWANVHLEVSNGRLRDIDTIWVKTHTPAPVV